MKKGFVITAWVVAFFLIAATAAAGIVKSDTAAEWAGRAGAGKSRFSFIVFGDNRPTSPARPLPAVLKVMLREIGWIHPDFVINTGDMIVGYSDTVAQAREELLAFIRDYLRFAVGVDMLVVPGNHEIRPGDIVEAYRPLFGNKLYYEFTYGNAHFVMVNTNFPKKVLPKGRKYGFYNINDGAHELPMVDWTRRALEAPAAHTFVVQHVPLFSALSPDFGKHPRSFTTRENRDEELELVLSRGVEAVFAGHEHVVYTRKEKGTFFFTLGGGGAPMYGPVSGGYAVSRGEGPPFAPLATDPAFEHGGSAKGHRYDLHLPAGAFSFFSYLLVTVDGDRVSYELLVPHHMEVRYVRGNDGIALATVATVANLTPYRRTYRGIWFWMPPSEAGYAVSATQLDRSRRKVPLAAAIQPQVLEVRKINDYQARVRVSVTVPGTHSIDVHLKTK